MNGSLVLGASVFIGSTIFIYIIALLAVLAAFGYLVYRTSPGGQKRREEKRNRRQ